MSYLSLSIEARIQIIEAVLRSLKQDMRAVSQQIPSESNPLRGKVIHYDDPYEPVTAEDWEALTFVRSTIDKRIS